MADGVKIEIVSPEKLVISQQALSVTVPGTEGYFTAMGEHAPLMSTLKPGFITVTDMGNMAHVFYVRGGFADVAPTILEACGVAQPAMVDGIKQSPIEGVSFAYTFPKENASEPSRAAMAHSSFKVSS